MVSVSNPQPKFGQYGTPNFGTQPDNVVDIRVKIDEDTMDFKQLSATASIANSGNLIVSESKEAMSAEVEGLLRTSKGVLDSIPYHERVISSCDTILRDLNPSFKKEKEQEEKMSILEGEVIGIKDTLNEMMGLLSNALGTSKTKKTKEE